VGLPEVLPFFFPLKTKAIFAQKKEKKLTIANIKNRNGGEALASASK
jgi:hypothetical protein